jgi:hypothetical protein
MREAHMTEWSNDLHWTSGCGRIELTIKDEDCRSCSHQGQCYDDVKALRRVPYVKVQLENIDPEILRNHLMEYGAWDDAEIADHDDNLNRLLWIACCDSVEKVDRDYDDEDQE